MKQYNDIIDNKIYGRFEQVLIIDFTNDKIYKYINKNNEFVLGNESSYTDYINNCQNFIYADDIQKYIDSLSITNFDDSNNRIDLNYRMINEKLGTYMNYHNNISLYDDEDNKIIVVLVSLINSYGVKESIGESKNDLEQKYKRIIDEISLSMLKIHNAINMDNKLRAKDEYINTILTTLSNNYPELNKSINANASDVYNSGKGSIIIADDDKIICNLLSKIFSDKYNIIITSNGEEAINALKENKKNNENVSCLFLDLLMPKVDGFTVLEYLNDNNYFSRMPVIVISGNYDRETKNKIYSYPIADMLEKPFNAQVIKHRVDNLINLYGTSSVLNEMMIEQHEDLRKVMSSIVMSYELDNARIINKIRECMKVLVPQFATMYPEYKLNNVLINKIINSSVYYGLANYLLPKTIISKKTISTKEEKQIFSNAIINSNTLAKYIISINSTDVDYKYVIDIIKHYTENYDGTGYPEGISGENIPIAAQLVAFIIWLIYLSNNNTDYNNISSLMISESNRKFNPKIVETFKVISNQFETIIKESANK